MKKVTANLWRKHYAEREKSMPHCLFGLAGSSSIQGPPSYLNLTFTWGISLEGETANTISRYPTKDLGVTSEGCFA